MKKIFYTIKNKIFEKTIKINKYINEQAKYFILKYNVSRESTIKIKNK